MPERFFDDLAVGDLFDSDACIVTEAAIIRFASEFDPQAFHLDPEVAQRSLFEGLAASGWHTAAITMRLFVTGRAGLAGRAVGLAVDELRWPKAVRPGDTLRVQTEVLEMRPSRSKPDRGIVRLRNVTTNQDGDIVQTMLATAMVPRRPAASNAP